MRLSSIYYYILENIFLVAECKIVLATVFGWGRNNHMSAPSNEISMTTLPPRIWRVFRRVRRRIRVTSDVLRGEGAEPYVCPLNFSLPLLPFLWPLFSFIA